MTAIARARDADQRAADAFEDRHLAIAELRGQGWSWEQIATGLSLSRESRSQLRRQHSRWLREG